MYDENPNGPSSHKPWEWEPSSDKPWKPNSSSETPTDNAYTRALREYVDRDGGSLQHLAALAQSYGRDPAQVSGDLETFRQFVALEQKRDHAYVECEIADVTLTDFRRAHPDLLGEVPWYT